MFNKKGIYIVIAMLVVAVIAAVLFSQGNVGYTQDQSAFCKNCHEMNPNIFTWEISSHNKVGCLNCHPNIQKADFIYKHWKGFYETPIVAKTFIPNGTCNQCHSETREMSFSRGKIVPHELHKLKGVDCIDCHGSISHFNISKQLIADGVKDVTKFDSKEAKKYWTDKPVSMATCMRCHNGDKATNKCADCHSEPPKVQK